MKLLLGCWNERKEGYIGVDRIPNDAVDVLWDFNNIPYPFDTNSADHIIMEHVLEHLNDPIAVMAELVRIAKPGSEIYIEVPYYNSPQAYDTAGHRHRFGTMWFKTLNKYEFLDKKTTAVVRLTPTNFGKIIPSFRIFNVNTREYASYIFGNVFWEIQATIKVLNEDNNR